MLNTDFLISTVLNYHLKDFAQLLYDKLNIKDYIEKKTCLSYLLTSVRGTNLKVFPRYCFEFLKNYQIMRLYSTNLMVSFAFLSINTVVCLLNIHFLLTPDHRFLKTPPQKKSFLMNRNVFTISKQT